MPRLISFQAKVDQRLDKPNKSVRENERLVEDLGMLARGFAARGEHALAYKYSLDRHSGLAPERIRKAGFKANNQPVRAVLESAQYALALNDIPAAKRHFKQLIDLGGEQTILSRPEDVFFGLQCPWRIRIGCKMGQNHERSPPKDKLGKRRPGQEDGEHRLGSRNAQSSTRSRSPGCYRTQSPAKKLRWIRYSIFVSC